MLIQPWNHLHISETNMHDNLLLELSLRNLILFFLTNLHIFYMTPWKLFRVLKFLFRNKLFTAKIFLEKKLSCVFSFRYFKLFICISKFSSWRKSTYSNTKKFTILWIVYRFIGLLLYLNFIEWLLRKEVFFTWVLMQKIV